MKLKEKMTALLSAVLLLIPTGIWAGAAVSDTGYTDVSAEAWYADSVRYCREQGVMTGIAADNFAPEEATSRAMLVSILYQNAGSPDSSGNIRFSDTASGAWYADALRWAVGNNVISGYSDGRFGPNDPVTREQLASILWRAAGTPSHGTTQPFADQSAISGYARDAVAGKRHCQRCGRTLSAERKCNTRTDRFHFTSISVPEGSGSAQQARNAFSGGNGSYNYGWQYRFAGGTE